MFEGVLVILVFHELSNILLISKEADINTKFMEVYTLLKKKKLCI